MIDTMRPECPDCQVGIGQPHESGCDVARCLWNGWQRLACEAFGHVTEYVKGVPVVPEVEPGHDCGRDTWTGWWPGELEAAALGLWCRWGPPWVSCGPEEPGAGPDVNRLIEFCTWDRERQQWLRRLP